MWRSSKNTARRKSWYVGETYGKLLVDGTSALYGYALKGEHGDIALRISKEMGRTKHAEQCEDEG